METVFINDYVFQLSKVVILLLVCKVFVYWRQYLIRKTSLSESTPQVGCIVYEEISLMHNEYAAPMEWIGKDGKQRYESPGTITEVFEISTAKYMLYCSRCGGWALKEINSHRGLTRFINFISVTTIFWFLAEVLLLSIATLEVSTTTFKADATKLELIMTFFGLDTITQVPLSLGFFGAFGIWLVTIILMRTFLRPCFVRLKEFMLCGCPNCHQEFIVMLASQGGYPINVKKMELPAGNKPSPPNIKEVIVLSGEWQRYIEEPPDYDNNGREYFDREGPDYRSEGRNSKDEKRYSRDEEEYFRGDEEYFRDD